MSCIYFVKYENKISRFFYLCMCLCACVHGSARVCMLLEATLILKFIPQELPTSGLFLFEKGTLIALELPRVTRMAAGCPRNPAVSASQALGLQAPPCFYIFLSADSGDQTQVLVCTAHALPSELSVSPAQDLHVLKRTSKKKTKGLR